VLKAKVHSVGTSRTSNRFTNHYESSHLYMWTHNPTQFNSRYDKSDPHTELDMRSEPHEPGSNTGGSSFGTHARESPSPARHAWEGCGGLVAATRMHAARLLRFLCVANRGEVDGDHDTATHSMSTVVALIAATRETPCSSGAKGWVSPLSLPSGRRAEEMREGAKGGRSWGALHVAAGWD
jgi:hypothetical protein